MSQSTPMIYRSVAEAVADAWASIDGKLDDFRAGRDVESILDEPGGHYSGYLSDAEELIRRAEMRGFKMVDNNAVSDRKPTGYIIDCGERIPTFES